MCYIFNAECSWSYFKSSYFNVHSPFKPRNYEHLTANNIDTLNETCNASRVKVQQAWTGTKILILLSLTKTVFWTVLLLIGSRAIFGENLQYNVYYIFYLFMLIQTYLLVKTSINNYNTSSCETFIYRYKVWYI